MTLMDTLITCESGARSFTLHPLVRASIHYWLRQRNEKADYMRQSLRIVVKKFPQEPHASKDIHKLLLTHANVVLDHEYTEKDDLKNHKRLLWGVVQFYISQGEFKSICFLLAEACKIEKLSGNRARFTLRMERAIAAVSHYQGRCERAEAIYRGANIDEDMLGIDDRTRVASLTTLASLCGGQEQYQEADEIYQQIIEICKAKYGVDSRNTFEHCS